MKLLMVDLGGTNVKMMTSYEGGVDMPSGKALRQVRWSAVCSVYPGPREFSIRSVPQGLSGTASPLVSREILEWVGRFRLLPSFWQTGTLH